MKPEVKQKKLTTLDPILGLLSCIYQNQLSTNASIH